MKSFIIKCSLVCVTILSVVLIINLKNNKDYQADLSHYPLADQEINMNRYTTKLSNTTKEYQIDIPENFEQVAENNHLALYLDEESLAIAVYDKSNGYVWFSYDVNADLSTYSESMTRYIKSGVSIETYNQFTPGLRTVLDGGVKLRYKTNSSGFVATVDFSSVKIKFDVVVQLDGNDVVIEVPKDSVSEYNPKLWTAGNKDVSINNLILYPFLGSTENQNDGYMILPDGSGALVSLTEEPKYKLGYSAPVYGKDFGYEETPSTSEFEVRTIKPLARVTLPIYGIIHEVNDTGMLVISESGANYATYNYVSKDVTTDFYQSYFKYNYRTTYKQFQSRSNTTQHILGFQEEPNEFNIKQRYVFLSGDQANYVGVAKGYRQFLESNNGFLNTVQSSESYPTKIDLIGNEIENGLFSTRNVTATPYHEAINLVKTLQDEGYKHLDVTYKTFNKSDSAYRFDSYRNLGGKGDLKDMMDFFNENESVDFNYYVDYITTYQQSKYTASKMNRTSMSVLNYSNMYLIAFMNNTKYMPSMVKEDLKQYQAYDIQSLSMDGLDKALYTQNDRKHIRYSTENMEHITDSLTMLQNQQISTGFYNPDAYLFPFTGKYYDAPITSSEQMFVDATIPLVQLITSGYMEMYSPYLNFISSEKNTLLRLVEYGINPSYVMTSENVYRLKFSNSSDVFVSEFNSLQQRLANYDNFLTEGLNAINGTELMDHVFLSEGVSLSKFANGTTIIVNYTDTDYTYNGSIIKAKGYDVL